MTHFTLAHYKVGRAMLFQRPGHYPQPHPVPPAQPQTILSHMEENQQRSRFYESPPIRTGTAFTSGESGADREALEAGSLTLSARGGCRCCSASKSGPVLCDPRHCSAPGSSVLHCLPEFKVTSRSHQSILKEIDCEDSVGGLMLKLKLQSFGHLM